MADFATVAELEAYMGTSGLGSRGTAMLGHASALIRGYTHQDLDVVAGRQEEHAANEVQAFLHTTQIPVTAVTLITINAVAFTDFEWSEWGQIHKNDWTAWDAGPIVVTYDSGWATTTDEFARIKGICLGVAARAMAGPTGLETFGPEAQELRGAAPSLFLTPEDKMQLDAFAQVRVG